MAPRLKRANRAPKFPWWLVIFVVAEFSLASALLILHLAMVIIEGAWYFNYYVPGLVAASTAIPMITWAFVSERWAQKYFHFPAVVFLYSIYMIYFCGVLGYSAYLYEIYSHSEPHDWDANHHELMRRIWAVVVVFTTPEAVTFLAHLIVISVCGEHHRWEEDDQSMAAKNGNQSKPTQHDSNSVRVEVQVASTDGSHEQSLPYQSDIAHYPPGGIHPLRMNLLGPTRPVSPHMIGLASSEARESSDAQ